MKNSKQSLWRLLGLIAVVTAGLAYVAADRNVFAGWMSTTDIRTTSSTVQKGPVSIKTDLVQDKVMTGSDGEVAVALTLNAAEIQKHPQNSVQLADLVIVLDRSGSMEGQKLTDARMAVLQLIDRLTRFDRLALVTYSNNVQVVFPMAAMDDAHRHEARSAVQKIYAGGGTNLGGGLQHGIKSLAPVMDAERQCRVILISDGLANQGLTDPVALGRMAATAVSRNATVSAVGVGYDFNEILMTTIADHGAGRYYFLENPKAFAQVFEKEFASTRQVIASKVTLQIPLKNGLQLINAGGYPVEIQNGIASIHPGDLVAGQQRKLFLTLKVPTEQEGSINLDGIGVHYQSAGESFEAFSPNQITVSCVADKAAVLSSIDREAWSEQVVQEDYNQLRDDVANAVRKGSKEEALKQIHTYEVRNRAINKTIGSAKVADNLDKDIQQLRNSVEETFCGRPAAVIEKQKKMSKALQYESYQIRRDKK